MKKVKLLLLITALLAIFCLTLYACGPQEKEEKTDYIIQYEFEGIQQLNVKKGQMFALQKIPQKTGYRFLGLFDAEIGGTQYVNQNGASVAAFQEDRNLVLYARFQPITYTIILDYQGGEIGQNIESLTAEYDAVVPELPIAVEKEHYVFKGWYTRPDSQGQRISDDRGVLPEISAFSNAFFEIPAEGISIRLYAGYEIVKYKVTLYLMENPSEFVEQEIAHGTLASEIKVEDSNGKTIVTWAKSKADAASGNAYNGPIESETILYGCGYGYGVTLKDESGKIILSDFFVVGHKIKLPVLEDKEYYVFGGWKFNDQIYQDIYTVENAGSIELYAYYKQKYEDYIYIQTAEEFKQISRNLSGKYMLLADINLGSDWIPLATYGWAHSLQDDRPANPFRGVLDGQGHTISYSTYIDNLNKDNDYGWGLFGTAKDASFFNIKLKASIKSYDYTVKKVSAFEVCVGGLVGLAENCKFESCETLSDSSITNMDTDRAYYVFLVGMKDTGATYAGGLVGDARGCQFKNCSNRATVSSRGYQAYSGGIVGNNYNCKFEGENANYSSVSASHGEWVWGIHGQGEIYGKIGEPWKRSDGGKI